MCLVDGLAAIGTLSAPAYASKKGEGGPRRQPTVTAATSVRSGERERGEWRTTPGDWQPGVFRTRDRCSSRMAWGSSSHWLLGGSRGLRVRFIYNAECACATQRDWHYTGLSKRATGEFLKCSNNSKELQVCRET
ncbi:hypothetical protein EYF80_065369 [Liparis tanakae]|uniref:Uncharacterized protein n=1 Tax=Liparis tanakae TaxID=230148 RepID=A0A4Z2E6F5_9TELE|nr:hypothetical protein EYF80_065369 [Liparis tanakae]